MRDRLLWVPIDITFAMAVVVVFTFFREEFNGASKNFRVTGFERIEDVGVSQVGVENGRFAGQLLR